MKTVTTALLMLMLSVPTFASQNRKLQIGVTIHQCDQTNSAVWLNGIYKAVDYDDASTQGLFARDTNGKLEVNIETFSGSDQVVVHGTYSPAPGAKLIKVTARVRLDQRSAFISGSCDSQEDQGTYLFQIVSSPKANQ